MRRSFGRRSLLLSGSALLVLVGGSLSAASGASSARANPAIGAVIQSAQAPAIRVAWGRSIAYKPAPFPGRRTSTTVNAIILEKAGLYWREVVEPRSVKVTCDVVYSKGWTTIVKRLRVPGGWRSDLDEYGGDGQVRCSPWTVWKGARGLWLQVTPSLVYRGVTKRGPTWRQQLNDYAPRVEPPAVPEPVSFLPRVRQGSIYPTLASHPFSSPVGVLWRAFGKPPASICSASAGLACSWNTAIDTVRVDSSGEPGQDAARGEAVPFTRVTLSTKDPSRTSLRGWTTPDGIHLGSTAAEVKRIDARLVCGPRECTIESPRRTYLVGDARYRFFVSFVFDGRPSNAGSRVIGIDVRQYNREEGACWVSLTYNTPTEFQFEATCSGKLKSARLAPDNGSTRLGLNAGYPADGSWLLYEDDGSQAPETAPRNVVQTSFEAGAHHWRIGCPEVILLPPDPFRTPEPRYCAPERIDPEGGTPAWRQDVFEEWHLTFRGTSSIRADLSVSPNKIAPVRFVAEFLDHEPFVYVVRRA